MSATPPLYASLSVALGGGIGALLRYHMGRWMTGWLGAQAMGVFPWATLAVNAAGCLAMGVLAGWLARQGNFVGGSFGGSDQLRLLLGVGLLGGFTTFSAFGFEMVMLLQRGQFTLAVLYAVLSLSLGISGLIFGLTITRLFT